MNWLDILVAIIGIYSITKGYKTGLVKQLASLIGVVACAFLSGTVATIISPYLEGHISENLLKPLAFVLSFLIIITLFSLLGYMLESIIKTVKLGQLNKLMGGTLCFIKWVVIISIFLNIIEKIDANHSIISTDTIDRSHTYKYIAPLATLISPYIKTYIVNNKSV